jgi:hypothetical protein
VIAALLVPLYPSIMWNTLRPLAGPRSVLITLRDQQLSRSTPPAESDEAAAFLRAARPRVLGMLLYREGEYPLMRRLLYGPQSAPLFTDPFAPKDHRMPRPWPAPEMVVADTPSRYPFRETATGARLVLVHEIGAYGFWATREKAEELHERGLIESLPSGGP